MGKAQHHAPTDTNSYPIVSPLDTWVAYPIRMQLDTYANKDDILSMDLRG